MYCQKCGSKVYKLDKYCGHCGKSLLHNDGVSSQSNEKPLEDIYRHNLDAVFGYALSPDYKKESTVPPEGSSDDITQDAGHMNAPSETDKEFRTLRFAMQVFTKPYSLIQSKDTYSLSVLWLCISIIFFIGSIFIIDAFEAAFYPAYYFYYLESNSSYFYTDLFYIFSSFFGNILFLIMIYMVSVIINTIIGLKKEYAVFNFRDIIILSSLAMIINILGFVIMLLDFTGLGYLLSRIGMLIYIISPFLLSIFYLTTGRVNTSSQKLSAISLAVIAVIIIFIHINLSIY